MDFTAAHTAPYAHPAPEARAKRVVVLALGNDILCDDGVGLFAARALRERYGDRAEIIETGEAGLALLELLEGYDAALILDATVTGKHPVGTVLEFAPEDFAVVRAPSPHYAGLPEVLDLARRMHLDFPRQIVILALEVEDPFTVREGLTPATAAAFPRFVAEAERRLQELLTSAKEA
ncbi:MAG: hydrogenase maturation protease [Candidatus Hydrogenedentota bacterium]|jgi:hydrogenase maturation protease|uniref:Hydrogenase maturation protease n=1 Tax=Sumerlaea chitinivorans TaxID=2250252 RepID=A0A2Z4Y261_SUMC1|nr:Hydrogenase maturation protease [Candidatus Sumerlaea chitinivorans]RMH25017.1 MAG: hydrogenase maturation protease [Candidatus Hydrogenedentota bacterium]GIX44740.1 MAG: HybD peptidase [Candidatus Sumerlaea sp.]